MALNRNQPTIPRELDSMGKMIQDLLSQGPGGTLRITKGMPLDEEALEIQYTDDNGVLFHQTVNSHDLDYSQLDAFKLYIGKMLNILSRREVNEK